MSDDGDRMCPLCAEDMDLTDQQLKPCKCGYEICVWCWHQIMDMAKKEESEGRCPACRTPYDKERIVGMAANCERVVAEVNAEKRQKSQKSKPKTSPEARKHLNSVRVIQRNLVYVIGLPCNLSDETLLERKEYFGQYGKVLKVSIARPTSAAQQASNNNTFSVYITYATEEEAIRCIQAVHNFVLEGKTLRACFGTTKYCHTWLRNMTCTNPDCLYLHDIGTQADSFTKDEIISAYTRSSVPQIASNNLQRRSGSVLPLPAGDVCNGGMATSKHTLKGSPSNCASQMKASLPTNSFVGKPAGLPAAASWGMRRQPTVSAASSQGPPKQKTETKNGLSFMPPVISSTRNNCTRHNDLVTSDLPDGGTLASSASKSRASENLSQGIGSDYMSLLGTSSSALDASVVVSAWDDDDDDTSAKMHEEKQVNVHMARLEPVEYSESHFIGDCQNPGSDMSSEIIVDVTHDSIALASSSNSISSPKDRDGGITIIGSDKNLVNSVNEGLNRWSSNSVDGGKDIDRHTASNGGRADSNVGLPTLTHDDYIDVELSKMNQHRTSVLSYFPVGTSINASSSFEPIPREHHDEPTAALFSEDAVFDANITRESHDISSVPRLVMTYVQKQPEDVACSVGQSDGASAVTSQPSYIHQTPDIVNNSFSSLWGNEYKSVDPIGNGVTLSITTDANKDFGARENESSFCNGHAQDKFDGSKQIKEPDLVCVNDKVKDLDISAHADMDMRESSIILNALSLDFDPWNDSFPAASGLVSLLRETDKQEGPFKSSNSWKSHKYSESRFSFARQENQANNVEPPLADNGHDHRFFSSSPYCYEGLVSNRFAVPVSLASHNSAVPSDRIVGGSRANISAPPGFSVPSKAPPPGFSSQGRFDQTIDLSYAENQPQQSALLHQHLSQSIENTGDVEFYDPAILAVGKGRLPLEASSSGLGLPFPYPMQTSTSEFDPRLQWLMQQSMTAQQDLRIQDHLMNRFLHPDESYMSSRILADNSRGPAAQLSFLRNRYPHVVHSQWDQWNDTQAAGNGVGMGDILRSERYGIHDYFPVNEDHKFYIPSSADTFNRPFGM